jgi:hypothetical protein
MTASRFSYSGLWATDLKAVAINRKVTGNGRSHFP